MAVAVHDTPAGASVHGLMKKEQDTAYYSLHKVITLELNNDNDSNECLLGNFLLEKELGKFFDNFCEYGT